MLSEDFPRESLGFNSGSGANLHVPTTDMGLPVPIRPALRPLFRDPAVTTTKTSRPIVAYPDARLRAISAPVEAVTPEIVELTADMIAAMRASGGIGLAAIQIGVPLRVVVMQVDPSAPPVAMINPEILARSDGQITTPEGCLSLPGLTVDVARAAAIDVRYVDVDGVSQDMRLDALDAVCFQHELDHLDGRLILDGLSRLKRQMYEKKRAKRA